VQTELNKIDISIKKAKITNLSFKIKDDDSIPEVEVSIDLLTSNGQRVTSICLGTDAWNNNQKISKDDIPAHVFSAVGTALRELGSICTRKINAINNLLEA